MASTSIEGTSGAMSASARSTVCSMFSSSL
jgi:hypothetical protein